MLLDKIHASTDISILFYLTSQINLYKQDNNIRVHLFPHYRNIVCHMLEMHTIINTCISCMFTCKNVNLDSKRNDLTLYKSPILLTTSGTYSSSTEQSPR